MSDDARLTHADLAERMNLPVSTVVAMRKREGWPFYKLGKHIRFDEQMAAEILASHRVSPKSSDAPVFAGQRAHRPRRSA